MTKDILRQALPNLTDSKLLDRLLEKGQFLTFEPGKTLMEPGQFIKAVPLVLEGSIKIMRVDEDGKELFLYWLRRVDYQIVNAKRVEGSETPSHATQFDTTAIKKTHLVWGGFWCQIWLTYFFVSFYY